MTDPSDFIDPDQADQWAITALNTEGIDTTQIWGVSADLGFFSEQAARQAAAELIMAGYSAVRVGQTGWNVKPSPLFPQMTSWTTTVTTNVVPTLDAVRSMRVGLGQYAAARGGRWASGGVGAPVTDVWASAETGAIDPATIDQVDQQLVDYLFAYDSNMKQATPIKTGLLFSTEEAARQVAAALIGSGYPDVSVVPSQAGWITSVGTYLVPKLESIRALRLSLTQFAQSRGGSWVGCTGAVATPKGFDEQPSL
jgi:hypothetical protein